MDITLLNFLCYKCTQSNIVLLLRNPLNDQIFEEDLKIDKIGYRSRILNKLKTGKIFSVI
jgi:hypothetical protein